MVSIGCPELHRHDVPAHHQGGAETRSEAEEEHRSTLVAPEGLHRGIVDDLHGATKRRREIEPDPAVGEVAFGDRSVSDDRKRTIEDYLGARGLEKLGKKKWRKAVAFWVKRLTSALLLDDVVIGGGNANKLKQTPLGCRR